MRVGMHEMHALRLRCFFHNHDKLSEVLNSLHDPLKKHARRVFRLKL